VLLIGIWILERKLGRSKYLSYDGSDER